MDDTLLARAREARELAAERLLGIRTEGARWFMPRDLNALPGAGYVIALRTTGLVETQGALADERRLVLHMLSQAGADGGFPKSPGGLSNTHVTAAAAKAIRLALGEVPPNGRPGRWYAANPLVEPALAQRLRQAAERAEAVGAALGRSLRFDEQELICRPLVACVDPLDAYGRLPALSPLWVAPLVRWSDGGQWFGGLNRILRHALPWIAILMHSARRRRQARVGSAAGFGSAGVAELAGRLQEAQNPGGSWVFNSPFTIAALMALCEAGASRDDPAVQRAYGYLRNSLHAAPDGGLFVNVVDSDVWDTALAVRAHLRLPGRRADDAAVMPSIEWVLNQQRADGAWAWGSNAQNDAENDTTAVAGQTLAMASRTAGPVLAPAAARASQRAIEFLTRRQQRGGGFAVWADRPALHRRGPQSLLEQALLDLPTAGPASRALESMAEAGLTVRDAPVRRCLQFLLRMQRANGSWWSRWWAGYIPGAGYVLPALGRLRICSGQPRGTDDALVGKARKAIATATRFLLTCQNPDGGWGEMTAADTDVDQAGIGESRPLQTAIALSALLSVGHSALSPALRAGVSYLLDTMTSDGRWEDDQATFTFIAGRFYYPYPLFNYFLPLDALTRFSAAVPGLDARAPKR